MLSRRLLLVVSLVFAFAPASLALPPNSAQMAETVIDQPQARVFSAAEIAALQHRADAGDLEAEFRLGAAYRDGVPILPQNQAESVKWFHKAADQGFAKAEAELGNMYFHGTGVRKDYSEALRWFTKAAQQADALAANAVGYLYYNGYGVQRNYSYAFEWFSKSAQQGDVAAQYALGLMYRGGDGVNRNFAEAAKYFHASAERRGCQSRCY